MTARPALLRRIPSLGTGAAGRFVAVGAVTSLAYTLLYVLLRGALAPAAANAVALCATALPNTQANRRMTFGVRGRAKLASHHAKGASSSSPPSG